MPHKPVVFLFCYRFFDIRLLVSAGVITQLAKHSKVVLLAPADIVSMLRGFFGNSITVEAIGFDKDIFEERGASSPEFKQKLRAYLTLFLGFIYGNQHLKPNISADLHMRSYLERMAKQSSVALLKAKFATLVSGLISKNLTLRRLIQRLYSWTASNNAHADLYEKYKPELIVTTTFGLSVDGLILTEAKMRDVPTCVIVQSWDKTSTKGYPAQRPDYAILWSDITAMEAEMYLDMPGANIYVEGSPLWDAYFNIKEIPNRQKYCETLGLEPDKKIIFVSIGSPCYHDGNKALIELLIEKHREDLFSEPVQLIFRLHPGYLTYDLEFDDFKKFLMRFENEKGVIFSNPASVSEGDGYHLFEEQDFHDLAAAFTHCAVSVSIVSSHLIESAIFDRPAIGIEYGRWVNEMYDFDLSKYTAEHLYRVYRTDAVYRAFNPEQMLSQIDEALKNPDLMQKQRKDLVDQELPVNRGSAAENTALRLKYLAEKRHEKS